MNKPTPEQDMQNIRLWLGNDRAIYTSTMEYVLTYPEPTYKGLIELMGFNEGSTPDGVKWLDDSYDYADLDDYIMDFAR